MRIKIIIEDKKKGRIEIPISIEEVSDVYSGMWIFTEDKDIKLLELNKCEKGYFKFHKKLMHIVNDIIHGGMVSRMEKTKKGDFKFVPEKKRHYLIRKPRWRK